MSTTDVANNRPIGGEGVSSLADRRRGGGRAARRRRVLVVATNSTNPAVPETDRSRWVRRCSAT